MLKKKLEAYLVKKKTKYYLKNWSGLICRKDKEDREDLRDIGEKYENLRSEEALRRLRNTEYSPCLL